MYVIVQHELIDAPAAFAQGERLKRGEGAPRGAQALQFYPSRDGTAVTCLWEAGSVEDVQAFVDETLGATSVNRCYGVDETAAFADTAPGLPERPSAATA